MGYASFVPKRRDGPLVSALSPATVATVATVRTVETRSVANVATVAEPRHAGIAAREPSVATVAGVAEGWGRDEVAFAERAAILEFDEGLSRSEAEAMAAAEIGYRPLPAADWRTRAHVDGPGVRIIAAAVELSGPAYDQVADALIATAVDANEAGRLRAMKRTGAALPDGERTVFTRGRR